MFCHMLVGLPATGKSTWVRELLARKKNRHMYVWVSTDNFIEMFAKNQGISYTNAFSSYIERATEMMYSEVERAIQMRKHIIWDQTNLSVDTRAKKLVKLQGYKTSAHVFTCPPHVWLQRLTSRPDKLIPFDALVKMAHAFEAPTLDEGFTKVYKVHTAY
jgi:predicted kinase